MFIRFDVIHERDRRTLHDSIDRACIASRGKNDLVLSRKLYKIGLGYFYYILAKLWRLVV